jgi:hypothetical protein
MVSMNCRRARNLLFDFFDGLSNETLRAEVDRHLGGCVECERFAAEMSRSLALLRRAPVEPVDENFNWKVRLAIHRERNGALARAQSTSAWVRAWNVRYAVSSGLAFGAVLVVGAVLLRGGDIPVPVRNGERPIEMTRENTSPAERSLPARSNTVTPSDNNASSLVSFGPNRQNQNSGPATGAIDVSDAEARIDSLIKNDVMRMSARERELYIQRRIEQLQLHLQSQQAPPTRP